MTAPTPVNVDAAEFAYRRGSLLTVLGAIFVVSVVTLSVQAYWSFTLTEQLLLGALAAKNAALFTWLWRVPHAFRVVGTIELTTHVATGLLRLYALLHSPPGFHGLGGYTPWLVFSYLVAFLVLPPRHAAIVTGAQFAAMLAIIAAYTADPAVPAAMKAGLGNSLLQTTLMHATFIAYLVLQQRLLSTFVGALVSARAQATLAHVDALTGLANRRQLGEWLRDALDCATPGAAGISVVLLDLDHFKTVNDTHGHDVGDAVLQHVAHGMSRSVRHGDRVGRWGGEEFLILVQGDLEAAQVVAQRLQHTLRHAPHPQAGVVTVSCGVTQGRPGERAQDVLRRADDALYHAKRAGRDTVSVAA